MSGEKSEKPTAKKQEDSRKKGQVAISKDTMTLAKLMSFYWFLFWMPGDYVQKFSELIDSIVVSGFESSDRLSSSVISSAWDVFLVLTVPLIAVCVIAATLSSFAQVGLTASPEALKPSFKKFDMVTNFKNMFSKKSLVQLIASVVKVLILSFIGYMVFEDNVSDMLNSYRIGLDHAITVMVHMLKDIVLYSLGIFIILALIDWIMERAHLMKSLRMSKHEIKDENKETQGNPELKGKMRGLHRNLLNSSLNRVGEAKAIVANPTHISVALDYEPGRHDLPFILAMGVDDDAMLIREKARKHGIPIIVNVKLARMLYADCDENEYIQKMHLELAAEVFKAVFEMAQAQAEGDNKEAI